MVPNDWLAAGGIGRLTSAGVESQRDINGLFFRPHVGKQPYKRLSRQGYFDLNRLSCLCDTVL